jgi:ribonuclease-3
MKDLLEKFNIKTNNLKLYETAFTHSSYAVKHDISLDYERLEFLGDSVLNMMVSDFLFKMHPNFGEGKLTKIRANYVCQQALIFYSHKNGLDHLVKLNLEDNHITEKEVLSITADVFESFLGAIYLDQGIYKAREFLAETVFIYIKKKMIFFYDYKSTIKEYGDAHEINIEYELVEEHGMPHDKTFTMCVLVDGSDFGHGTGKSKKEAEQLAAKEALDKLGIEGK